MDLAKINENLNRYLRPQSYPVALRMCTQGEILPARAKIPGQNLDLSLSVCHAIAMTRRYGWTMALDRSQTCWVAALGLGFAPLKPDVADGTRQAELGIWGHSKEAAAAFVESFSKLEYGKYERVLTAPLERADFDPHLILIYGHPSQIWVLVSAYLYPQHKFTMNAALSIGAGCTTYIAKTMITDEPQFGLVGIGERFNNAQDHECVLAIPASKIEMFMNGLALLNKAGFIKYPILGFLRYNSEHPEGYRETLEHLQA
jgi:uncharacterized protein (DUF169 family)